MSAEDGASSRPLHIGFLGPSASFSHQAAREAFQSSNATLHPLPSFQAIFEATQGSASNDKPSEYEPFDYTLVPVENSTNGGVIGVLDLLIQCGLSKESSLYPDVEIVAEHYLEVHHCLFVHPSAISSAKTDTASASNKSADLVDLLPKLNITALYSHPQVWGQCAKVLSKYFPTQDVERIDTSSTSAAAVFVARSVPSKPDIPDENSGVLAAISSSLAGQENNLYCLAANIEDFPGKNTTRFFVLQNKNHTSRRTLASSRLPPALQPPKNSASHEIYHKSLITFMVPHSTPGSLASALAVFREHNLNLTAISTRPSRERNWHYVFFVECERTGVADDRLNDILRDLGGCTERISLLGSWVDRLRHPQLAEAR